MARLQVSASSSTLNLIVRLIRPSSNLISTIDRSRLNELTDDILVLILSKLTIKEAVRTSILSHRWENLWVYYAGSLIFHRVDEGPIIDKYIIERPRFISRVNHVLNLHQRSTVDEFSVRFVLDSYYGDDIERWIKFAMEKKVSRFELDFSVFMVGCAEPCLYFQFPYKLLDSPNNFLTPFGSLTSLRFNCVDLSDEVLAYFVSNCQLLEHLSIIDAPCLYSINVTTALKLKLLEIEWCRCLGNVNISNTNIESLKFDGEAKTKASLENLHLLTEVSLKGFWSARLFHVKFEPLPISQLQSLEIDLGYQVQLGGMKFAEVFPTFWNLKHLKISLMARHDQNIFCVTSLICASPLLNSFTLKVTYLFWCKNELPNELPNCEWRKFEPGRIHECLKRVEFKGWHGYNWELDLIYYLIQRSVVLEKVIIDPKLLNATGDDTDERKENAFRERANLLQNHVPPGVEFVIL